MKDNDIAILVGSFDGDEDLWGPFFKLFFQYWPDCPWPIYLQTNHKSYADPRVISMKLGPDSGFSDFLATALRAIPHEHVLYFLDDFLLTAPVNTSGLQTVFETMKQRQAGYFRLCPVPKPDEPIGKVVDYGFGRISKGQRFRAALQLALWRRTMLLGLIKDKEAPRAFEMGIGERSFALPDEFLSLTDAYPHWPVPYYVTGVIHGYWVPDAVEICRKHGIEVDLKKRPLQPWLHRMAHGNPVAGAIRKVQWTIQETLRGTKK